MTPVTLPRSREERLVVDGRDYRIFVAWPAEPPPAAGWPMVVVLDANAAFATVVEAIRMRSHRQDATGVGPALVVGIAYPGDGPYERRRRTYDYTQAADQAPADGGDGRAALEIGGGPRFLELLTSDLPALLGRHFAIDPTQRALIGHSLAGYFVLHTLVTTPGAFTTYVAMSPSIWWDRAGLDTAAQILRRQRTGTSPRAKVRITAGEYEQALAPWQAGRPPVGTVAERRAERQMIDQARAFGQTLEGTANLLVEFAELAGEDHASVVPRSVSDGLRLAFREWPSQKET